MEERTEEDYIIATKEEGYQYVREHLNEKWLEWRRVSTQLIGGNILDFMPDQWQDWEKTIYEAPVPLRYNTLPIQRLIFYLVREGK